MLIQRIRPKRGPIHAIQWLYPQSSQDSVLLFGSADGTVQGWRKPHGQVMLHGIHLIPPGLIRIFQPQFVFECSYTVFEGSIEAMALDEARSLVAIAGLGRVIVLRMVYNSGRGEALSISAPHWAQSHIQSSLFTITHFRAAHIGTW